MIVLFEYEVLQALKFLQQHERNLDIDVIERTRKRREKRRMIMGDSYCLLCY
jgi:hypothetical protein